MNNWPFKGSFIYLIWIILNGKHLSWDSWFKGSIHSIRWVSGIRWGHWATHYRRTGPKSSENGQSDEKDAINIPELPKNKWKTSLLSGQKGSFDQKINLQYDQPSMPKRIENVRACQAHKVIVWRYCASKSKG